MTARTAPDVLLDELLPTLVTGGRTLRRLAGPVFPHDALTTAQREVVFLVVRRPGRPVSEVGPELGLAPNTVSTMVSRLVAQDVLDRTTDSADRRVGRLSLTPPVQARID